MKQFAFFIFVNDTGFYWAHRLFHHPSIYGSASIASPTLTYALTLCSQRSTSNTTSTSRPLGLPRPTLIPCAFFQEFVLLTASRQLEDLLANGLPTAIGAVVIGARTSVTCQSALIFVTPHLAYWALSCTRRNSPRMLHALCESHAQTHTLDQAIWNAELIEFPDPVVWWLWLWVRMLETLDAHSGYNFPFSPFQLLRNVQGGADRYALLCCVVVPYALAADTIITTRTTSATLAPSSCSGTGSAAPTRHTRPGVRRPTRPRSDWICVSRSGIPFKSGILCSRTLLCSVADRASLDT